MEVTAARLEKSQRDWRVWFGITITVGWLAVGSQYILRVIGWDRFTTLPADGLGGFLEGAFAPLAFLWLVIGFFLQQRELTQNTSAINMQYEVMRKTAEQAEIQARAITLNEIHQQRETFLKVVDLVFKQLGVLGGFLYMSSQTTRASQDGVPGEVGGFWSSLGGGDPEVFSRELMARYYVGGATPEIAHELLWSTEVRARHSSSFMATFERLLAQAEACDIERTLRDALEGSAHGIVYRIMMETKPAEPEGGPK